MANDSTFLGIGWRFPPSFTANGADVEMISGTDDIEQSLQILLCTSQGERVMQDDFGCNLHDILFKEIDQHLINRVTGLISDAILYHEPRIKLESLDVTASTDEAGLLYITIDYTVRSTNSRYNMVYPFYLKEAATPGL